MASRFKKKGCPKFQELCNIFGDTTATGDNVHPSTKFPSDSEDDVVSVEDNKKDQPKELKRKRADNSRKTKKDTMGATLNNFLECMVEQSRKRSDLFESKLKSCFDEKGHEGLGQSAVRSDESKVILHSAIDALSALEGIDGEQFSKCFTKLHDDSLWREMFMKISDDRKVDVIRSLK